MMSRDSEKLIGSICYKYKNFFTIKLYRQESISISMNWVESQFTVSGIGAVIECRDRISISDAEMLSRLVNDDYLRMISDKVHQLLSGMLLALPEERTGNEPLVRLYKNLLFKPSYVLSSHDFLSYAEAGKPFGEKGIDGIEASTTMEVRYQKSGDFKVVTETKKKKKIIRPTPKLLDPTKVKKPECKGKAGAEHPEREMSFSPVKGKWVCPFDGCKMTARPVRDEDDKSVILGKGDVTCRVVATGDNISVLLISDDNVALDITDMIEVKHLITSSQLINQSRAAETEGKNEFRDPTKRLIPLAAQIGVIGVSDLLNTEL